MFATWQKLVSELLGMGDTGAIWRGQERSSWNLRSSLERQFDEAGVVDPRERELREHRALSWFQAAAPLRERPDDEDTLSWLVAMQHYGAPTRLLDWTESPFVACYFAFRDLKPSATERAALWAFPVDVALEWLDEEMTGHGLPMSLEDRYSEPLTPRGSWPARQTGLLRQHLKFGSELPLPVVPARPDERMIAQQTVMTVDARLKGGLDPTAGPPGKSLIMKFELDPAWRKDALRDLAMMGISDANLFPGPDGAGRHAQRIVADGFRHLAPDLQGL